jgi:predicted nucleotide-binding protein
MIREGADGSMLGARQSREPHEVETIRRMNRQATEALQRIYRADQELRWAGRQAEEFRFWRSSGVTPKVDHRGWDSSWPLPDEEIIDELGDLDLLDVVAPEKKIRTFSLTREGRHQAKRLIDLGDGQSLIPPFEGSLVPGFGTIDPLTQRGVSEGHLPQSRRVAVMHGRDKEAKLWLFDWLRRVGLEPLEWSELVNLTGKGAPYNGEIVEAAFSVAQAVVVLLTPDELGSLHPELSESEDDRPGLAGQPRLNVILEAGMAFQSHPDKTVLVEIGKTREISDLAGRNAIRLDGEQGKLNDLANRLERAKCPVRRNGADWLDVTGLRSLSALRREYVSPRPSGGIAAIGVGDSPYWVFRLRERVLEARSREDSGWSGWLQIGVLPADGTGLAASSLGPDHAEVFVLLAGGEVLHTWWRQDSGWHTGFLSLGNPFGDGQADWITAASTEEGHQEIFVGAADGKIANIWYLSRRWHPNNDPKTSYSDGWSRF